jgi:hypothetical protein
LPGEAVIDHRDPRIGDLLLDHRSTRA